MKYVLSVIAVLLICQLSFAGKGPALKVLSGEWDFGDIEQGSSKQMVFSIKNTGFDELSIDNMHACCGYSIHSVSKWRLAPGEQSQITIINDASRKPLGKDAKHITILSNSAENPQELVPVKAHIIPGTSSRIPPKDKIKLSAPEATLPTHALKIPSMHVDDIYKRIKRGSNLIILDVREKHEYTYKHIPNSIRFARSDISSNPQDFDNILSSIHKRIPIFVCCSAGIRSSYIVDRLRGMGYNAYNMEGGISAWESFGHGLVFGPPADKEAQGIPIGLEEAYSHYFTLFHNKTFWIDLRDPAQYKVSHIKGAVNIPLHELKASLNLIPKDKHIILYCEDTECGLGETGSVVLIENGFERGRVRVFSGGLSEWSQASYPIHPYRRFET
jgi:rhodanese-related sulfurtransferase